MTLIDHAKTLAPPQRLAHAFAALVTASTSEAVVATNAAIPTGDRLTPLLAPASLKAEMLKAAIPLALLADREQPTRAYAAELRRGLARFLVDDGLALKEFTPHTSLNELRPYGWILRSCASLIERLSERATVPRSLGEEVRMFLTRITAFDQLGVLFINGSERRPSDTGVWEKGEIDELTKLLQQLPTWLLRGTPLLTAIVRTRSDVDGWQGSRASTGEIEICDESFQGAQLGEYLPGWSNAQIILCHELGHSFQFGDRYTLELSSHGTIAESGHSIAEMARFASLSEWTAIRRRPRLSRQGTYARLNGLEIPLETPLKVLGESRVQLS